MRELLNSTYNLELLGVLNNRWFGLVAMGSDRKHLSVHWAITMRVGALAFSPLECQTLDHVEQF